MNINEELYDLAERFLMGDFSDQERETIETLLKSSPEFQLYVSQIQKANQVLFLEGLNLDHQTITKAENKYFFRLQLIRFGKWLGGIGLLVLLSYVALNYSKPVVTINKSDLRSKDTTKGISQKENLKETGRKKGEDNRLEIENSETKHETNKLVATSNANELSHDSKDSLLPDPKKFVDAKDTPLAKDDPCIGKIKFSIQTSASCEDKSEGGIRVYSISGGKTPYSIRLNNGNYSEYPNFNFLTAGDYTVHVKDGNNCKAEESVVVPSKKCLTENVHVVFSYQKGEDWKLPETSFDEVEFQLFSTSGKVVYSARILNNAPTYWNGLSENGQRLLPGLYPYKLFNRSANELILQGTITVVD